jgi:hypothetical protein
MRTLAGRIMRAPIGMARADPPIPTGMIGTPVRTATNGAPSKMSSTRVPVRLVPSGKITIGSPARTACSLARSASRSGVPRRTGIPPSEVKNHADQGYFHMDSLPM